MLATLKHSMSWDYQDWRGRDRETDLDLTYTCDADGYVRIASINYGGPELDDAELDRIEEYLAENVAPEAYGEWLAERAEWSAAA